MYEKTLEVTVQETKGFGSVVKASCHVEVVTACPSASLKAGRLKGVTPVTIAVTVLGKVAAKVGAEFVTMTLKV